MTLATRPSSASSGAKHLRIPLTSDFVAAILTGIWLFVWRAALDTPWGFAPIPGGAGLLNIGIVYNPGDTWSYLSWVQQYSHGQNLAGLLYTTEPHAPLLWLFPLWLIGKLASLTGLPVLGVYNGAGLAGAMAAVFFFRRAASALRLTASARNWATTAFVLGSGSSWLWHLAYKLGLASPAHGGDLIFLDLFPSTAIIAYAYHSIGLALLAGLWWSATESENSLLSRTPSCSWLCVTAAIALLLGFSRPYEPVAFLAAWLVKTGCHWFGRRHEPASWRSAALVSLVLGFSLLPGIGLTVWVSKQPVWSTFASESLALGLPRLVWLCTLVGWIILATLGLRPAYRANASLAALPVAASVLFGVVLLGFGSAHTKLASGLLFGPILLAGWGAARLVAATHRLPRLFRIGFAATGLSALLGIPSLYLDLTAMKLQGPALVDAELVALAHKLPVMSGQSPPIVLTDGNTGCILPGLVGARVWVGHWSLSPDFKNKTTRLEQAGLDPQMIKNNQLADTTDTLAAVLADTYFDYALLDRRCVLAFADLARRGWQPLETTPRWCLLRAPHPSQ